MANDLSEQLAGARMQVDGRFNDRILDSQFSNQEWGLIMTAVEFEIDQPEDPAQAQLVANTDNVSAVIGELGDEQPRHPAGTAPAGTDSSGGILDRLGDALGLGSSESTDDTEQLEAAEALAREYADELQAFLEEEGRWAAVCESATNS
ncbi:DUF5799 family protein [Halovenus marina]|uniref:DUF5799 family protein n=1 Tax=Halovenus marina TaxID=3396621 RepID=UPI003F55EC70